MGRVSMADLTSEHMNLLDNPAILPCFCSVFAATTDPALGAKGNDPIILISEFL